MKNVFDAGNGVQSVVAQEDGKIITGTVQDCTAIAAEATRRRLEGEHGSSEMRLAATFPVVLVETYCNNAGITMQEWMSDKVHIKRMMSDPALSAFRVWEGQSKYFQGGGVQ